jgi:hypothetical protein
MSVDLSREYGEVDVQLPRLEKWLVSGEQNISKNEGEEV